MTVDKWEIFSKNCLDLQGIKSSSILKIPLNRQH